MTKSDNRTYPKLYPDSAYKDVICKWCGKIVKRTNQCMSAWKLISTCGKACATFWKHHKCSLADMPIEEDKFCKQCGAKLIRRANEHRHRWEKRQYCDKAHAALGKVRYRPKTITAEEEVEIRSGVIKYKRDTPEFAAIAALYM